MAEATAPTANTASGWGTFLGGIRDLAGEYIRYRYMDVERPADDDNIPDRADLRYAQAGQVAGVPASWLILGAAAVGLVWLVARGR